MNYKVPGFLFLTGSLLVVVCGIFITRKLEADANYRSVGCVRITWGLYVWMCSKRIRSIFHVDKPLPGFLLTQRVPRPRFS
jgi:hypothetical protein